MVADRKALLDAIARELHGWPDDGTRRTYAPEDLLEMVRALRPTPVSPGHIRCSFCLGEWPLVNDGKFLVFRTPTAAICQNCIALAIGLASRLIGEDGVLIVPPSATVERTDP